MKIGLFIAITAILIIVSSSALLAGGPEVGVVGPLDGALSARQFTYHNANDIVLIAQKEMDFNGVTKDAMIGAKLLGTTPDTPLFVTSLDAAYPDYYIVKFLSVGRPVAIAIVGVKDGKAEFKECHSFDAVDSFPAVSADAAKGLAQHQGLAVGATPKLVFKFSKECGGPAFPAWDLGNSVRVAQNGNTFSEFTPEPKIVNGQDPDEK